MPATSIGSRLRVGDKVRAQPSAAPHQLVDDDQAAFELPGPAQAVGHRDAVLDDPDRVTIAFDAAGYHTIAATAADHGILVPEPPAEDPPGD